MKIRLSYGTLGNQQVSNTLFYSLLNSEKIDWLFGSGQNIDRPTGVKVGDLVNFTPTWEKTTTINVGLDVALFSKLSGTFDVYNRKTTDMLTAGLSLPDILGATPPKTNAADLETKGWELSLTWRDELKNGLRYDISFNLADNFSKITKFSSNEKKLFGKDNAGNERYYVGQTLGEIWGFDTDGIYQSEEEVKAIADLLHAHNMYLHMDGARLANACAYLNCSMKQVTVDAGVDILSFGGTKNGMMMGEAVVSFRPEITENLQYYRKQSAQLASKLRYLSAQFIPYLENNLWLENAMKANISAAKLAEALKQYPQIQFTQKVETNQIFFTIPAEPLKKLQDRYFFYMWNEDNNEARLVTSWDTTGEDIAQFEQDLKEIMGE